MEDTKRSIEDVDKIINTPGNTGRLQCPLCVFWWGSMNMMSFDSEVCRVFSRIRVAVEALILVQYVVMITGTCRVSDYHSISYASANLPVQMQQTVTMLYAGFQGKITTSKWWQHLKISRNPALRQHHVLKSPQQTQDDTSTSVTWILYSKILFMTLIFYPGLMNFHFQKNIWYWLYFFGLFLR